MHGCRQLVPRGVLLSQETSATRARSYTSDKFYPECSAGTAGESRRKARATASLHAPNPPGYTRATMGGTMGSDPERGRQSQKPALSPDCGLQLARMTVESLVIGGHYSPGEYVPAPCTHRPSSQPSRSLVRPTESVGRTGERRGGLSRHKVAVGEPAAGSS